MVDEIETVLSQPQLVSLLRRYVGYLTTRNQTARVDEIFKSMIQHNDFGRGLEPMFRFMSRHGMPENFPDNFSDTSLFAKCGFSFTTKFEANLVKMSSYWWVRIPI